MRKPDVAKFTVMDSHVFYSAAVMGTCVRLRAESDGEEISITTDAFLVLASAVCRWLDGGGAVGE